MLSFSALHSLRRIFLLVALGVFLGSTLAASQSKAPLTNEDIMRMVHVKFDDATIIMTIQTFDTNFDVSVDALLKLKEAGVSQPVIQAMLSASTGRKPAVASGQSSAPTKSVAMTVINLPDEVGVYVVQKGQLITIDPEIVNWRTGGVIKAAATLGLDKGHVTGPHSKLQLTFPPFGMGSSIDFYIRCIEGNSAPEYQLLRFWEKGDRREFRAVTGGVLHASGGAKDNVIEFKYEKVAPRVYRVDPSSVAVGEYGFLAPGAVASTNVASQGKIYTFRIIE